MPTTVMVLEAVSQWAIPALILVIIVSGAIKRVPMYESFVTGAKEGFNVAVMIIPYLVAMLFAIKVFVASGVFDDVKYGLVAAMQFVGMGAVHGSARLAATCFDKAAYGWRCARRDARNLRLAWARQLFG
jgi:spore maturation protein SpmB